MTQDYLNCLTHLLRRSTPTSIITNNVTQDYLNCLFHRLPSLPTGGEIVGFSSMYTVNQDDVTTPTTQ